MVKESFGLYSLSGQRLYSEIKKSKVYSLDSDSILQINRILHDNNIHLLSRPQYENLEAKSLADNIYSLDPYGFHYRVYSEAEYILLKIFNGNALLGEIPDIVETIAETGFSFVVNPNTSQENTLSFVIGSAPCVWVTDKKTFLPVEHPDIMTASDAGLAKSMRYAW